MNQSLKGIPSSVKSLFQAIILLCTITGFSSPASAVPSYARQTGQPCVKCHVGAFGPQLTPYGIRFKLSGYTESDHKGTKIPLAFMAVGSFTQTKTDQASDPNPYTNPNNNATIDQVSGFFAGRVTENFGTFVQVTYDGNSKGTSVDNIDLRLAHDFVIAGHDAILGLSLNNNPGVQDAGNTLVAWNFPYMSSALIAGTGDAASLLNGGLSGAVTGLSAYAFIDDSIYAEIGTYRGLSPSMQIKFGLGAGNDIGRVDPGSVYWRLNYLKDMNTQAFSAGLVGFNASLQPERIDGGPVNSYRDVGIDASYQYIGKGRHSFAAYTSFIREDQTRGDLLANGGADNLSGRLYEFRLNGSYYYDQTYGLTVGRFSTRGTPDATRYSFSATGSPDTSGTVFQIDWTPWGKAASWARPYANARLGLQYTVYDRFDGSGTNYDGSGRNAGDNNTLFMFFWLAI
jgi:hypothetical protein